MLWMVRRFWCFGSGCSLPFSQPLLVGSNELRHDPEGYRLSTLYLEEAARHVGLHPITLAQRAKAGKIPGASKPGKRWIFPVAGLDAYLNAHSTCPFTGEEASGGLNYPRTRDELESLLGLPTRSRRRNTTRNARANSGARQSSERHRR
jgi:hypothetical protein